MSLLLVNRRPERSSGLSDDTRQKAPVAHRPQNDEPVGPVNVSRPDQQVLIDTTEAPKPEALEEEPSDKGAIEPSSADSSSGSVGLDVADASLDSESSSSMGTEDLKHVEPVQPHHHRHREPSQRRGHRSPDENQEDAPIRKTLHPQRLPPARHIDSHVLYFAILGDWGGPGREPQREVAAAMSDVANNIIPRTTTKHKSKDASMSPRYDFVVSTGDNMYEDGVASVHDIKFKRNFEKVYTQPALQCPWLISLGNHDHGAHGVSRDVAVQVEYTSHSTRWFLPATYYTQRFTFKCHEGDHNHAARGEEDASKLCTLGVVVLDTYDVSPRLTKMTPKQLAWFEKQLIQLKHATWRIVVGHRPVFSAGAKHGSSPYMQKKLLPLMRKHKVAAYLCGDDHELQLLRDEPSGVVFVVSGGGARAKSDLKKGGLKETLFQYGGHGFVFAELRSHRLVLRAFDKSANELYNISLHRP